MLDQQKNHIKWHRRFLELAQLVASWSKDRSTKVGAVAVGSNLEIRSVGYNGFPRGVDDDVEERHERPAKYVWTEHAERNCIFNASRIGVSLENCSLYCTHFPCPDCARGVIQSGITEIYYLDERTEASKSFRERIHKAHFQSLEMLESANVKCFIVKCIDNNYIIDKVKEDDLLP